MRTRWLVALFAGAILLTATLTRAVDLTVRASYAPGLFTDFQFTTFNFGPDWKLVSTQIHPTTGWFWLFYQNTRTGEIAVHLHKGDTGAMQCHDPEYHLPATCVSGMIIN